MPKLKVITIFTLTRIYRKDSTKFVRHRCKDGFLIEIITTNKTPFARVVSDDQRILAY